VWTDTLLNSCIFWGQNYRHSKIMVKPNLVLCSRLMTWIIVQVLHTPVMWPPWYAFLLFVNGRDWIELNSVTVLRSVSLVHCHVSVMVSRARTCDPAHFHPMWLLHLQALV
jgi:hypothetical protein